MAGRVLVIGSLNADLVVGCTRAPGPGETVLGTSFVVLPGGKGANQAVAAARAGAATRMAGCVGRDDLGRMLRASLRDAGVDDRCVRDVDEPTGTALILVDAAGENRIVVVAGANRALDESVVDALAPGSGDHVVLQLEVRFEVVQNVARSAAARGAVVHLNAAPADRRALALADCVDHLIVNEVEAALLVGATVAGESAEHAALEALRRASFRRVTLTLGERGALHADGSRVLRAPAPRVAVVDTTAAGDAFLGSWVAAESDGAEVEDRLRRAVAAGTLAVTRAGAQSSLPAADRIATMAATIPIATIRVGS